MSLPLNTPIYLDESKKSYVTLSHLPENLLSYVLKNYDMLFSLHPEKRDGVIHKKNGESSAGTIARYYKSYGNTPKYNSELHTSYMFGDMKTATDESNESSMREPVPQEFRPVFDYFNSTCEENLPYNQMVVNWYEDGNDYIAKHADYDVGRTSDIVVVNINSPHINSPHINSPNTEDVLRKFVLSVKSQNTCESSDYDVVVPQLEIPLTQGLVIRMGGDVQKKFRHGVPKNSEVKTSRISFTLRRYED